MASPRLVLAFRVLSGIAGVGLAAWGLRYAWLHRNEGVTSLLPPPPQIQMEANIEVGFQGVAMAGREKGIKRWDIWSDKVSLTSDGRYTLFEEKPFGKFYNLKDWSAKDGEDPVKKPRGLDWKADSARFDSFTEDLEMTGHAVITTDAKDVIRTEVVKYASRDKKVNLPTKTTVDAADSTKIICDSLTADSQAEVLDMKGHVSMDTKVEEENRIEIPSLDGSPSPRPSAKPSAAASGFPGRPSAAPGGPSAAASPAASGASPGAAASGAAPAAASTATPFAPPSAAVRATPPALPSLLPS